MPSKTVVAHVALADGHAYLQPADAKFELFHNHEFIETSAWLKSGDRVQVGDWLLHWDVKGDQVFIKVENGNDEPELQPPAEPPPDADPEQDIEIIAVDSKPMPAFKLRRLRYLLLTLFSLLALIALFVIFATPVAININPEPADQSVSGFPPAVSFGSRMLVVPGTYTVEAQLSGYQPLQQSFVVSSGGFQAFDFDLEELPGRLQIMVDPEVPIRVSVAGADMPVENGNMVYLQRGMQELLIETDRYLAETREIDIAGFGELQELQLSLRPAWADVRIDSEPQAAQVHVDGEPVGQTPLVTAIMQGQREIELSSAGFKPRLILATIVAGSRVELDRFILEPNDGTLLLDSQPQGATVSIGGSFHGSTPVEVRLASGTPHKLTLSRPGYSVATKTISLEPDEEQQLQVDLVPEYGVVFASSKPADASLTVDGKRAGSGTQRLRLTTRPHELVFSKPGYLPQTVTVTPRTTTSQNVDVVLKTMEQAKEEARPAVLRTAGGQEMRLLDPQGTFQMGASRREAGRRANESRRLVELTRPFYLSSREVSNAQYRRFDSKHRSGSAEGVSLNGDRQPVVNVSWDDAARYCNWLSEQDNLAPAYVEKDGRMQALPSPGNGYRLPTEAEWVYVARVAGRNAAARYPWGEGYPPGAVTGNFADAQIADTLANVVKGYNDGYRASAPVGSFDAQPEGFHDLGGNVAEWTNDFYAVYPGQSDRLVKDPTGPANGDHHVVRGSSWRDGSITELRLSYRDYSRGPRDNLGFRIARYADE
jgi:formylglycine-generating enzyme required for sulfatase activity